MSRTLEVADLRVILPEGSVAVDGISFGVDRGEVLGIVGESGSGKTLTALALLKLLPENARMAGTVELDGADLAGLDDTALNTLRGLKAGMVFQDSATNFNPVQTIGTPIIESIRRHRGIDQRAARHEAVEALRNVGIGSPEARIDSYPHEFSGGQRQRAMIALALVNRPRLLIADEPTTALDATVQAQILDLLKAHTADAATILITHDFGVAAEMCDRILVLYHGRIVEEAPLERLLAGGARHPYTAALIDLIPRFDRNHRPLPIPGAPPAAGAPRNGCSYRPRCTRASERCGVAPAITQAASGRFACWNPLP